jgi:hypothetical protein
LGVGSVTLVLGTSFIAASSASAWYPNSCAAADGQLRLWVGTHYTGACGEEATENVSSTAGQFYNDGHDVLSWTYSAEDDDTYFAAVTLHYGTYNSGASKMLYSGNSSGGIGFNGVGSIQWWA